MSVPFKHDHGCTREPVCPYCGHEQSDFWEHQGEDGECECGNCSRVFQWSRYVDVTYNTEPIIGPHKLSDYSIQEDAADNPIEEP